MRSNESETTIADTTKRRLHGAPVVLVASLLVAAGCSGGSSGSSQPGTVPNFNAATFTNPSQVTNTYFPLVAEMAGTYSKLSASGEEVEVIETLDTTRVVMGVTCAVVQHREFEEGLLVEDTEDWYAQDDAGNVWYMGEDVSNFEYDSDDNLIAMDKDGSWEAGLDVAGVGKIAKPGYIMRANPMPGERYSQEFYKGQAEDIGEVIALGVSVTLADGSTHTCLQVRDSSPLEPGAEEDKYYAPGIGLVLEQDVAGPDRLELVGIFDMDPDLVPDFSQAVFTDPTLVDNGFLPFIPETAQAFFLDEEEDAETIIIEVLDAPRVVMGIPCRVVRDRVFQDGLLIEDTHDWYAQDDAGNVWYMGEEVDNYEYDEDGEVIGIDNEGAWEAGLDVAGVGVLAEPGFVMKVDPAPGESYFQEYYEDEAEDMGYVVAEDVEVELGDGSVFAGCLQILDWNPLEPDGLEYKYFAPGIGLILEQPVGGEELLERLGSFGTSQDAVPDFAAATFTAPMTIDHPFSPLTVGSILTYGSETEDGAEVITVEVLNQSRVVNGVSCVVVQDVETVDGIVMEDTLDWYAQDDAGNLWYMGEDVINYEYDDDGILLGTNNDGSWEAGLDIAMTGSVAQPGYLLNAMPMPADSFFQEFYEDEALDLAAIVTLDAEVELGDGTIYEGCLQVLEWNPLEPDGLEYKYYAPGIGLVLEEDLADGERVELESAVF